MSNRAQGMTLHEAQQICREMTCAKCGAGPGLSCNYVGPVPNAGKPMRGVHHEERWKSTGRWPFTITDV